MARPKKVIDTTLIHEAESEIKCLPEYKTTLRLRAIISCADHSIDQVGSVLGVSRQTVWRWIKRFKEEGIEGLYDRSRGYRLYQVEAKTPTDDKVPAGR